MNLLKKFKHDKHDGAAPNNTSSSSGNQTTSPGNNSGPAMRISWPPKDVAIETLGEVIDTRGNKCPRDIGRSFKLGGNLYYAFGDSFHFDRKGEFCGCSNNTVAHIPDPSKPCQSTYGCKETYVPNFIPLTKEEAAFNEKHKDENWRMVTWPFGGVVEDEPGCGKGWIWFDIAETHGAEDAGNHGVRAARVIAKSGCHIEAERTTPDERIFPKEWPQFGHCAAVLHEGHVYCLGGVKQQNYMARMKHGSDPSRRSSYEYWTKSGWAQDISGIDDLVAVLSELGQGEIVSMPGRGPGGSGLMMLGCNHFGDGNVYMGFAFNMTGPWAVENLGKVPGFFKEDSMRYAIFPHTWACDWNKGQLLFTFSDNGQMGCAVIAAKLKFAVEEAK